MYVLHLIILLILVLLYYFSNKEGFEKMDCQGYWGPWSSIPSKPSIINNTIDTYFTRMWNITQDPSGGETCENVALKYGLCKDGEDCGDIYNKNGYLMMNKYNNISVGCIGKWGDWIPDTSNCVTSEQNITRTWNPLVKKSQIDENLGSCMKYAKLDVGYNKEGINEDDTGLITQTRTTSCNNLFDKQGNLMDKCYKNIRYDSCSDCSGGFMSKFNTILHRYSDTSGTNLVGKCCKFIDFSDNECENCGMMFWDNIKSDNLPPRCQYVGKSKLYMENCNQNTIIRMGSGSDNTPTPKDSKMSGSGGLLINSKKYDAFI